MIEVQNLCFGYRRPDELFQGFTWSAARGEVWSILGPSGCGKTTLLYLLAGLRRPIGGSIKADGRPVEGPRRSTGLILQDHGLLPWATAEENAALGLRIRGVSAARRAELVDHWLETLGIAGVRRHYPWQLSGGQRQRVAIARCLVLEPDLLLMDEPFASLDALTREDLQELLLGLTATAARRLTVVLVTHDVAEAVLLGQVVMVLPQPPIAQGLVLENALAGRPSYRLRTEFHQKCLEVRAAVARARGRANGAGMGECESRLGTCAASLGSAGPDSGAADLVGIRPPAQAGGGLLSAGDKPPRYNSIATGRLDNVGERSRGEHVGGGLVPPRRRAGDENSEEQASAPQSDCSGQLGCSASPLPEKTPGTGR